ncbi:Tn3 family transposase [Streptomyces sp. NPDC002055]|uniref:Tn3 family transposase n=1 Tax=Streptomyces sp. NPDC002055 TaxID=3154534 RepID=UPI00333204EA
MFRHGAGPTIGSSQAVATSWVSQARTTGEHAQPVDGGGRALVLAADGVVEGEGELHEPVDEGKPRGLDVGVQALGAGGDVTCSGVLDQGDDLGEGELVICSVGVGEIHGGLQVVENWNSANTVLHAGKDGALTGPDKEHVETSMLALYLLQSALVHVNTLLVQQVLAEPAWAKEAERRGPARADRAVLVERQPVRHLPPRHGQAPRLGAAHHCVPSPRFGGLRVS